MKGNDVIKPNNTKRLLLALSLFAVVSTGCANLKLPIHVGTNAIHKVDRDNLLHIDEIVKTEIDKGNFPGAVILVGQKNNT